MDVYRLTDELEQLIQSGVRVPLTARIMLDERQLLDIIDRIRLSIPDDIQEARRIMEERDSILRDSHFKAQRIAVAAQQEVDTKIDSSDITALARNKAEAHFSEATAKADSLLQAAEKAASLRMAEADQYALTVLRGLDAQLTGAVASIRKGIEALVKDDKTV